MPVFEARQAAIALLVGFAGLARRSEVAGLHRGRWRLEKGSVVIQWSGQGYQRAKGDQESKGQQSVVPAMVLGWPLAKWMEEQEAQLVAWKVDKKALFFRNATKPREAGWAASGEAVNRLLKRVVEQTVARHELERLPAAGYTSHSLRRGGAQFLRDSGVTRELIMALGRWKSDAVVAYLDTVLQEVKSKVAGVFAGRWRSCEKA